MRCSRTMYSMLRPGGWDGKGASYGSSPISRSGLVPSGPSSLRANQSDLPLLEILLGASLLAARRRIGGIAVGSSLPSVPNICDQVPIRWRRTSENKQAAETWPARQSGTLLGNVTCTHACAGSSKIEMGFGAGSGYRVWIDGPHVFCEHVFLKKIQPF